MCPKWPWQFSWPICFLLFTGIAIKSAAERVAATHVLDPVWGKGLMAEKEQGCHS